MSEATRRHPHVILSCATTADGLLDDSSEQRLVISDASDLARVDALRASCDAILVGAGTVRADNPRLLVRDPALRWDRRQRGDSASPLRVTVTGSGRLPCDATLFTSSSAGAGCALVYAPQSLTGALAAQLGSGAAVASVGEIIDWRDILTDLAHRGVRRLLVEGGAHTLAALIDEGLADEWFWAVAPWSLQERASNDALEPAPSIDAAVHAAQRGARTATVLDRGRSGALDLLRIAFGGVGPQPVASDVPLTMGVLR